MDDNSRGHILTLQARREVESHAGELVATLGSVIIVIIMVPGFFSGSKPKDYLDHPWWWACALLEGSTRGHRPTTGPTGAARWGLQSRCDSTAASGVPGPAAGTGTKSVAIRVTQAPPAGDNEGTGPAGPRERDTDDRRARHHHYCCTGEDRCSDVWR